MNIVSSRDSRLKSDWTVGDLPSLVFRLKYSETRFFGCSVPIHFVRQFGPLNSLPNLVYRTLKTSVYWIKAKFFSVFSVRNWCIQQLWHILQKIYLKSKLLSPKYFVWKPIVLRTVTWHAIYDYLSYWSFVQTSMPQRTMDYMWQEVESIHFLKYQCRRYQLHLETKNMERKLSMISHISRKK
jgi:hypothetical protein